mgnify:CR=1 FL=1
MARYTGPKVRLSRRLNTNIFENEKGRKALDRRPFPPGAHGRTRRRNAGSEYLAQLQEKQKAKYIYGVLERQFRKIYEKSTRLSGPTGENLLRLLELRLDNVVYRMGFAATRAEARQLVGHRGIKVNEQIVNIPSYQLKAGDKIAVRDRAIEHERLFLDPERARVRVLEHARERGGSGANGRARPAQAAPVARGRPLVA